MSQELTYHYLHFVCVCLCSLESRCILNMKIATSSGRHYHGSYISSIMAVSQEYMTPLHLKGFFRTNVYVLH